MSEYAAAGIEAASIDGLIAERLTLTPGGTTLVRTMHAHGARTCLVSGGYSLFTGPIAARIGFEEERANRLGLAEGRLDGTVAEPIVGRAAKRETLIELREKTGLGPAATMAVSRSSPDPPAMACATASWLLAQPSTARARSR